MAKGNSIKEEIRLEQKAALEGKDFKYKMGYYLHYYKYVLLAVIAVLIVAGSLIKTVAGYKANVLSIALINASDSVDYNGFISEYQKIAGVGSKEEMHIDASYNLTGNGTYDTQLEQKLYISTAADQVDAIIAPASYFEKYAESGYMHNLELILSDADKIRYADSLHYSNVVSQSDGSVTNELTGIGLVNISPLIRDSWYKGTDEEVYLGVIVDSVNMERVLAFLEYIQK